MSEELKMSSVQFLKNNLEHTSWEFNEFISEQIEYCKTLDDRDTYTDIEIRQYILEEFNRALLDETNIKPNTRQSPDVEGAIELIDININSLALTEDRFPIIFGTECTKILTTIKNKLNGVSNEQD